MATLFNISYQNAANMLMTGLGIVMTVNEAADGGIDTVNNNITGINATCPWPESLKYPLQSWARLV